MFGRSLENFLVPKDLIRHIVVTVDNLPRRKTAVPHWPLKPTVGKFTVIDGTELTLSEDNAARYAPFIKVVQSSDPAQIAADISSLLSAVSTGVRRSRLSRWLLQ